MRIRKRPPSLLLVVVAILMFLLPLLAYLQYDWLGKVSEREREQMQTSLALTLGRLSEDFDGEIARIFTEFQSEPSVMGTGELAEKYAKVLEHWNSTAPYPKLIRDIFLLDQSPTGDQHRRRLVATTGKWESEDSAIRIGPWAKLREPVDTRIPAIVISVFRREPVKLLVEHSNFLAEPEKVLSVIVRLDVEYIRTEFVPELVRSHFANSFADYKLQIQDDEDGGTVIYSSEPGTEIQGNGDATERILTLGSAGLRMEPFTMAAPATAINRTNDVFSVHVVRGFAHSLSGSFISEDSFTTWKIVAAHRSGSLDTAVAQLRRKNLAISFSILAMLAASVSIVLASAARAQRLGQQQMEFVSAVSHELRTPLAVIRSAGENLADGVVRDPAQLKSYGEVIRNEGRRLTDMVEQVLSFAGIQAGLRKQTFVPLNMTEILERALEACEIQLRESKIRVDRQVGADLPAIMGDRQALTRAVQNLISNAIKYGTSGQWIGLLIVAEGEWLKLAVQDRGPGILSFDLPHIFEPFYRGRSAVDAQIQGSGLGLSLVKQAVESHGGQVDVTSNLGSGSTFYILLPIPEVPSA